jgi:hypothetical protein
MLVQITAQVLPAQVAPTHRRIHDLDERPDAPPQHHEMQIAARQAGHA